MNSGLWFGLGCLVGMVAMAIPYFEVKRYLRDERSANKRPRDGYGR